MKKLLTTFISAITFILVLNYSAFAISFMKDELYSTQAPLPDFPDTIEATIRFPQNMNITSRGGVIVGNYDGKSACINLEVYSNGVVRVYIVNNVGKVYDVKFTDTNVYTGEKVHITVVNDSANGKYLCYIDGELKQSVSSSITEKIEFTTSMTVGGDNRQGNAMYCRAEIFDLAMYSDVRTASEIASDYTSSATDTDGIIAYYDLSASNKPSTIVDKSGNGNDFKGYSSWFDEVELPKDFSYSFAVVGDTQIINKNHPKYMVTLYDWIVDNASDNKLKFVFGLGDITDANTHAEWALAKAVTQKLDGIVPYSLVRGNHDGVASFNQYFPYSEFSSRLSGSYDNTVMNSYQFFTVNGIKYLVFTLDYGASDNVLNWAGGIIEKNPDCNVIITTHAYLYRDGTTLDENDVCPPSVSGGYNNGDDMWDKLIKKHENIVLVLSGHDPCDNVVLTQTKGENGNVVSQLLIDPQGTDSALGGTGLVAMLYFSQDGKTVDVRYYSTAKNMYYLENNQFSFNINVIEPDESVPEAPSIEISGISFNVNLTGNNTEGKIVEALYDDFGIMTSVKIYDAAKTVPVSFPSSVTGSVAKVFWWNGTDTLIPVCTQSVLGLDK